VQTAHITHVQPAVANNKNNGNSPDPASTTESRSQKQGARIKYHRVSGSRAIKSDADPDRECRFSCVTERANATHHFRMTSIPLPGNAILCKIS